MSAQTAAPPAQQKSGSGELSHKQIMTILTGLMMGMFLAALDQTIVSTAIRTIGDDLHGLSAQAWVTTAYLITSTIATPLYGKLSDIFGRRGFYLFAIIIFVVGSLLCSFATSMYMLAAFRAIQGIGAGGLMSLALAVIGDILPPRERAKYQGYFLAVFATSSVLGPVIGGFFAEQSSILGLTGWRWVFLINVPIGFATLLVVWRNLHLRHTRQDHKIDYWGAVALTVGLVPLLTVAEQGRTWGWGSGKAVACFVIGALGLIAFVIAEAKMKDEALIPLRIFRNRAVSVTIIASVIIGMAMFGAMMMLPLYMQIVHNASPMKSGLMMLPLVAGMMTASIVSGQLTAKTGRVREFPIVGTAIVTVGMFLLNHITADTPLWQVMVYMAIVGTGLGNCMQALTLIVQNAVNPREIGMATSSATFFRQMGGTIGVAVFLSMLFSTVGGNIKTNLADAAQTSEFKQAIAKAVQDQDLMKDTEAYGIVKSLADPKAGASGLNAVSEDSSVISRLPKAVAHPFEGGFAQSMDHVFILAAGIALLGFIVLLFLPKIELRGQSASAMTQEEDSAEAAAAAAAAAYDGDAAPTAEPGDQSASAPKHGAVDLGKENATAGGQGAGAEGVGREPALAPSGTSGNATTATAPTAATSSTASSTSVDHEVDTAHHGATAAQELIGTTAAMCGGHTMDERCDDPGHDHAPADAPEVTKVTEASEASEAPELSEFSKTMDTTEVTQVGVAAEDVEATGRVDRAEARLADDATTAPPVAPATTAAAPMADEPSEATDPVAQAVIEAEKRVQARRQGEDVEPRAPRHAAENDAS